MDFQALLRRENAQVVYWHDEDDGPPVAAIVDLGWLAAVWDAATGSGGYEDPDWTSAGREHNFLNHGHTAPEDRSPARARPSITGAAAANETLRVREDGRTVREVPTDDPLDVLLAEVGAAVNRLDDIASGRYAYDADDVTADEIGKIADRLRHLIGADRTALGRAVAGLSDTHDSQTGAPAQGGES